MIWSFIKVALFVVAIAGLTLGAAWLSDSTEGIRIAAAGMEFTLGPLQAVIAALVLVVLLWVLLKAVGLGVAFLRFLNGDDTAVTRYFDRNREKRGLQAVSDGLLAIASGDGKMAQAKAAKAHKLLDRPELTNLLKAQAAELQGDTSAATEVYKQLLADDRTRFAGVRGLMLRKLDEGDTETALRLAEKAFEMQPRHRETQDVLLKLQTGSGNWAGARSTLAAKKRYGALPRDVHRRRDALLALQEARDVLAEGSSIEAREAAISANKSSPDLIPAAVMAARGYIAEQKPKYAARVLKKAWEAQPHPDLAQAYAEIAPSESPAERLQRFEALLAAAPSAEETRLTRTELLIANEDFPAARRTLGELAETHPTARTLTLMAAIARGEGRDDQEVRGWLARAVTANRGPQWICDKCQSVVADWGPVCPSCGGFDTLSWRDAPDSPSLPNGAEMLPLIIGGPRKAAPVATPVATPDAVKETLVAEPPRDVTPPVAEALAEPEPEIEVLSDAPRPARRSLDDRKVMPAEVLSDDPFDEPPSVAAARGAKAE